MIGVITGLWAGCKPAGQTCPPGAQLLSTDEANEILEKQRLTKQNDDSTEVQHTLTFKETGRKTFACDYISCPAGSLVEISGDQFKCKRQCPETMVRSGDDCICPENQFPDGSTNRCVCAAPLVMLDGKCRPPVCTHTGEQWNGKECSCGPGRHRSEDGDCLFPACAVPAMSHNERGECVCPSCSGGAVANPGQACACQCPPGKGRNDVGTCVFPRCEDDLRVRDEQGDCVCKSPLIEGNSGRCQCPDGMKFSASKGCVCPAGQVEKDGRCVCKGRGKEIDDGGRCACPDGADEDANGNCEAGPQNAEFCCDNYGRKRCQLGVPVPVGSACICFGVPGYGAACR